MDSPLFNPHSHFFQQSNCTAARDTRQDTPVVQRRGHCNIINNEEYVHHTNFLEPFMLECICPKNLVVSVLTGSHRREHTSSVIAGVLRKANAAWRGSCIFFLNNYSHRLGIVRTGWTQHC